MVPHVCVSHIVGANETFVSICVDAALVTPPGICIVSCQFLFFQFNLILPIVVLIAVISLFHSTKAIPIRSLNRIVIIKSINLTIDISW